MATTVDLAAAARLLTRDASALRCGTEGSHTTALSSDTAAVFYLSQVCVVSLSEAVVAVHGTSVRWEVIALPVIQRAAASAGGIFCSDACLLH